MRTNAIALTLAAALMASTAVGPFAQDAGVSLDAGGDVGVDVEAGGSDTGVDAGVDAGADAEVDTGADANAGAGAEVGAEVGMESGKTVDDLSSALTASGSGNLDLTAVTDESEVTIVRLSDLAADADGAAGADASADIDALLTANAGDMTSLHSQIEANAAITAKLEAEGIDTDEVVALDVETDGSATVYVDDRA